jgi:hypothetical protein
MFKNSSPNADLPIKSNTSNNKMGGNKKTRRKRNKYGGVQEVMEEPIDESFASDNEYNEYNRIGGRIKKSRHIKKLCVRKSRRGRKKKRIS